MSMKTSLVLVILTLLSPFALSDDGLVKKSSAHSVEVTAERLSAVLQKKGIKVFANINHQSNAEGVKLELGEVQLLLFGNPRLGTPLMQSNPTAGIDLPMKALIWEDREGKVWLAYNDPSYLVQRHGIKDRQDIVKKMSMALNNLTDAAISP